jgi:hypothetical protein
MPATNNENVDLYVGGTLATEARHRGSQVWSAVPPWSPLEVSFTNIYWTEGDRFKALGLTNGAMVANFPDEVASADLVQATDTLKPTYVAASGINGKPALSFVGGGTAGQWLMVSGLPSRAHPNEYFLIFRNHVAPSSTGVFLDGATSTTRNYIDRAPATWRMMAGTLLNSGVAADENAHLLEAFFNTTTSQLRLDGTVLATGAAGSQASTGYTLGGQVGGAGNFVTMELVFMGVKNGALSTDERVAMRDWASSRYVI